MNYYTFAAISLVINDMESSRKKEVSKELLTIKNIDKFNGEGYHFLNKKKYDKPIINYKKRVNHPIIQPRGQNH